MRNQGKRGFTLMELLVVIALIALLVTVMVPVMLSFMKGRGLGMMSNNVAGFIAFARSEAMNRRMYHKLVYFYEEEAIPGSGLFEQRAGPGMVLYRINRNPAPGEQEVTFVRQLDFEGAVGGGVDFAESWKSRAARPPEWRGETAAERAVVAGKYSLTIEPDGYIRIFDDKPGYVLDTEQTKGLQVDLVLTDGDRFVFMDINPATGTVKRSPVIDADDTDQRP
jgi:prepilin-type N-terminal cleavage/methylation domain-containing protein